jgi:hypothetical protein
MSMPPHQLMMPPHPMLGMPPQPMMQPLMGMLPQPLTGTPPHPLMGMLPQPPPRPPTPPPYSKPHAAQHGHNSSQSRTRPTDQRSPYNKHGKQPSTSSVRRAQLGLCYGCGSSAHTRPNCNRPCPHCKKGPNANHLLNCKFHPDRFEQTVLAARGLGNGQARR